jgi:hypothetical protein
MTDGQEAKKQTNLSSDRSAHREIFASLHPGSSPADPPFDGKILSPGSISRVHSLILGFAGSMSESGSVLESAWERKWRRFGRRYMRRRKWGGKWRSK